MQYLVCGYDKTDDMCWSYRVNASDSEDAIYKAAQERVIEFRRAKHFSTPCERYESIRGMVAVAVVNGSGENELNGEEPFPVTDLDYIEELI